MFLMILIVWLLSALTSIPPLFGWGRQQKELECTVSDDLKYQIYATLLAFYLPSALMIIVYINIYRAARKIKKREMETAGRLNNFNTNNYNNNINSQIRLESNNLTETPLLLCNQNNFTKNGITNNKKTCFSDVNLVKMASNNNKKIQKSHSTEERSNYLNIITNGTGRLGRRVTQVFNNIKCSHSNGTAFTASKNQKATTTLGVIMGCFILCWLPFFILAVLKPIKLDNNRKLSDLVPKWLDSFLLWLGYFNSALNPMIYARFNREFRRPFIEILCFKCKNINERLRDEERKKMYPGMSRNEMMLINNLKQPSMSSINNHRESSQQNLSDLVECNTNNNNNNDLDKITTSFLNNNDHQNNKNVTSSIEIETIKEKTITFDFDELKTTTLDCSSSPVVTDSNNLNDSTQSVFKSETDLSHFSVTLSSLNSSAAEQQPTVTNLSSSLTNTVISKVEDEKQQLNFDNFSNLISSNQRSKTSKKRKLHSNYPKISSDTIKKYYKPNKNPRLAYCTFNSNINNKKFSRQINLSPFMLSHITSYVLNQKDLTSDSNNKLFNDNIENSSNATTTTTTTTTTTVDQTCSSPSSSPTISKTSNHFYPNLNGILISNNNNTNNNNNNNNKMNNASYLDCKPSTTVIATSENCV